jgi:hypothetical protein
MVESLTVEAENRGSRGWEDILNKKVKGNARFGLAG